jgi:hypothetical protein
MKNFIEVTYVQPGGAKNALINVNNITHVLKVGDSATLIVMSDGKSITSNEDYNAIKSKITQDISL